jgi:bacterial/archaeal transporter family-2 protein
MDRILTILIGLLGGISVGIQSPIVGEMGQRVGGVAGSFLLHLSGTLISALVLLLRGGENITQWQTLPIYAAISGVFGLVLVTTINRTISELGAGAALLLIIAGQLAVGLLIDHFGWFGVPVRSLDLTRAGAFVR